MTNIPIPPEAVEAAMKAVIAALMFDVEPDVRANQLTTEEYANVARTALRAGLAAWPGMRVHKSSVPPRPPAPRAAIILPLTENSNERE